MDDCEGREDKKRPGSQGISISQMSQQNQIYLKVVMDQCAKQKSQKSSLKGEKQTRWKNIAEIPEAAGGK